MQCECAKGSKMTNKLKTIQNHDARSCYKALTRKKQKGVQKKREKKKKRSGGANARLERWLILMMIEYVKNHFCLIYFPSLWMIRPECIYSTNESHVTLNNDLLSKYN